MEFKEFLNWAFLGLVGSSCLGGVVLLKLILDAILELKISFSAMDEKQKGFDRRIVSLEEARKFRPQ